MDPDQTDPAAVLAGRGRMEERGGEGFAVSALSPSAFSPCRRQERYGTGCWDADGDGGRSFMAGVFFS